MAATAEELKELALLARESGDLDLEEQALTQLIAMQEQGGPQTTPLSVAEEFAAAVNRGVLNVAEFLTTDQINEIARLSGHEGQLVTPLSQTDFAKQFTEPQITQGMEEGLARDVVRTGGEFVGPGGAAGMTTRAAARAIPMLRPLAGGALQGDVALSAVSGAGSALGEEVGGETGALVGSILAPIAGQGGVSSLKRLVGMGAKGIRSLTQSLSNMSEDGAATLLAEAMVRENMGPDDVIKRMAELGPEAIPADVGNNFARLLRTAANKIPRIEGEAAQVFKARHAGQGNRILNAFDDASGVSTLSVDDEISRLNEALKPQVDQLYAQARSQALEFSPKLKAKLNGKGSLGRARKQAEKRLVDLADLGEQPGNLALIDQTKRVLDDQIGTAIRGGQKEKAMILVRLKNEMVKEADEAIPSYKEARDLFAGKRSLESAAELGESFFKLKAREMPEITKALSQSEMKMFKLGAKRAIIDRVNDANTSADLVKRMFGKNGDVQKLKSIMGDQYDNFASSLKREADFVLTRRAAQANSTTAKQIFDEGSAREAFDTVRESISSPIGTASALGRVIGGLANKKGSEAYVKSLEHAGDILLTKGVSPERVQRLLRKGTAKQVEEALRKTLMKDLTKPQVRAAIVGGAQTLEGQQ